MLSIYRYPETLGFTHYIMDGCEECLITPDGIITDIEGIDYTIGDYHYRSAEDVCINTLADIDRAALGNKEVRDWLYHKMQLLYVPAGDPVDSGVFNPFLLKDYAVDIYDISGEEPILRETVINSVYLRYLLRGANTLRNSH